MTLELGYTNTATIDHVIPKSKGGLSDKFNEVAACHDCNSRKADKPLEVFLSERKLKHNENNPAKRPSRKR